MKWSAYDPDNPPGDGDYLVQLHNGDYAAVYIQNDVDTDLRTGRDFTFASITVYRGRDVDPEDIARITPIFGAAQRGAVPRNEYAHPAGLRYWEDEE